MPSGFLEQVGVNLIGELQNLPVVPQKTNEQGLTFVSKPAPRQSRRGTTTAEFQTRKSPNYLAQHANNTSLGLFGEQLVLAQEINSLIEGKRPDLAEKVVHVSVVEGDGAGYDIRSFNLDGSIKFIEVKSTKGSSSSPFFISPNEIEFSKKNPINYFLYRLFDLDMSNKNAKVYVINGDLSSQLDLKPTQYIAEIANNDQIR